MLETTKKIVEELKELKKEYMVMLADLGFEDLDDSSAKLMVRSLKLMDMSTDLMVKQAELMEGIDKKLDELLDR